MWWNFVGRSHEEIVALPRGVAGPDHRRRRTWPTPRTSDGRFGVVVGDHLPPIPAPPLPNARLSERR